MIIHFIHSTYEQFPKCSVAYSVFHLGFRRGTLSFPPGTQFTRLGISNTHPPQLRVQTESVKYVDIASYYNYVHKLLSGIVS